jgi:hypothetical protein
LLLLLFPKPPSRCWVVFALESLKGNLSFFGVLFCLEGVGLGRFWLGLAWIVFGWVGLAWIVLGLAWPGLAWIVFGLAWPGLAWIVFGWAWVGLDRFWLGWLGSFLVGSGWVGSFLAGLGWIVFGPDKGLAKKKLKKILRLRRA